MGRLGKEIKVYERLQKVLKEARQPREVSSYAEELGMTENSILKYLEAAAENIDCTKIIFDGQPLTSERIREYFQEHLTGMTKELKKSTRLTKLINLLNSSTPHGGMTLEEIKTKLGVSERTIFRDLAHLEEQLNIRIIRPEKENGLKGKYRLENTYLPPLSPDKALFIYLSLLQQKDTALNMGIQEIKQALIGTLTKNRYKYDDIQLDKMESRIHIVDQTLTSAESVGHNFLQILKALEESKVIKIKYFKASTLELIDRTVQPYGLICKHHNWYLVGRCLDKLELRNFRIDQIESVYVRSETFIYPSDFDIRAEYADSWGVFKDEEAIDVKVCFSPKVAYRLKKIKYHESQKILQELEDGSLIVGFKLTGLTEFVSWLLQWRSQVKVLEPYRLRKEIFKAASDILSNY